MVPHDGGRESQAADGHDGPDQPDEPACRADAIDKRGCCVTLGEEGLEIDRGRSQL
ncbi:MAG: hypothetical protein AAFO29_02650 [Actinomycetota bacterium]